MEATRTLARPTFDEIAPVYDRLAAFDMAARQDVKKPEPPRTEIARVEPKAEPPKPEPAKPEPKKK